jgi:hypothetical protein
VQGNEQGYKQCYDEIIWKYQNWFDSAPMDQCLFLMLYKFCMEVGIPCVEILLVSTEDLNRSKKYLETAEY